LELRIKNYELGIYNDLELEEEIVLIGRVIKEPDVRETNTKLTIEITQLGSLQKTHDREFFVGRVLITVSRYPE